MYVEYYRLQHLAPGGEWRAPTAWNTGNKLGILLFTKDKQFKRPWLAYLWILISDISFWIFVQFGAARGQASQLPTTDNNCLSFSASSFFSTTILHTTAVAVSRYHPFSHKIEVKIAYHQRKKDDAVSLFAALLFAHHLSFLL